MHNSTSHRILVRNPTVYGLVDIGSVLLTSGIALAGWIGGFITAVKAADRSARQQIRYQKLADAWLMLESQAHENKGLRGNSNNLEQAVAIVQLYGTPKLMNEAQQFAVEYANTRSADIHNLLNHIRDELTGTKSDNAQKLVHLRIQHDAEPNVLEPAPTERQKG